MSFRSSGPGSVVVTVVEGKNLAIRDKNSSDPYVKLRVGEGEEQKTTIVKKNLNPQWEENFTFSVKDTGRDELHIEVWDWDMLSKDDFMGRASVLLSRLKRGKETKITVPLKDVECGEIVISLRAKDFGEE